MYDWPEVSADLDALWSLVVDEAHGRGLALPERLSRAPHDALQRDDGLVLGQVCALHPAGEGLGRTEVIGTLALEPPPGLPDPGPGTYYSVIVGRADDPRLADAGDDGEPPHELLGVGRASAAMGRFAGCTVAVTGVDSQSGYWSLGGFVRDLTRDGPFLGEALPTGAHRASVAAVAEGRADLAAVDVHSWRLALDHEPARASRLAVVGLTEPTSGIVCVTSTEHARHRGALDGALAAAVERFVGTAHAARTHVVGYRSADLDEFRPIAERAAEVARRPWHR